MQSTLHKMDTVQTGPTVCLKEVSVCRYHKFTSENFCVTENYFKGLYGDFTIFILGVKNSIQLSPKGEVNRGGYIYRDANRQGIYPLRGIVVLVFTKSVG